MSISLPVTQAVPTTNLVVTQAPKRRTYKRKYTRRKRYPRYIRRFRSARRMYPSSSYGYRFVPRSDLTNATYGETWRSATDAQKEARKNDAYFGRGLYTGMGAYNGRGLTKFLRSSRRTVGDFLKKQKIGQTIGSIMQQGIGMGMGQMGMSGSGMYTGSGAYRQNDLFSDAASQNAIMESGDDETGGFTIAHEEYIGEVYGNEYVNSEYNQDPDSEPPANAKVKNFQSTVYNLNPGLEKTFPWLSQLAQNYQEYEMIQMVWRFQPCLADVSSSNGQVGEVLIVTQYKNSAIPFPDKASMMNYVHKTVGMSTDDLRHGVECDPEKLNLNKNILLVRNQGIPPGETINDYDWGFTQVCVHNTPSVLANQSLGSLHVYYKVKLTKPILFSTRGLAISRAIYATGFTPSSFSLFSKPLISLKPGLENNQAISVAVTPWEVAVGSVTADISQVSKTLIDQYTSFVEANNGASVCVPDYTLQAKDSVSNLFGVRLTFPASYYGSCEIVLSIRSKEASLSIPNSASAGVLYGDWCAISQLRGNVTGIADLNSTVFPRMLGVEGGSNSANVVKFDSIGMQSGGQVDIRFRVNVSVATKAVDNTVTIFPGCIRSWDNAQPFTSLTSFGNTAGQGGITLNPEVVGISQFVLSYMQKINNISVSVHEVNVGFGSKVNADPIYVNEYGDQYVLSTLPSVP